MLGSPRLFINASYFSRASRIMKAMSGAAASALAEGWGVDSRAGDFSAGVAPANGGQGMNFVFFSPHFPSNGADFCDRLRKAGATVLGMGDAPYSPGFTVASSKLKLLYVKNTDPTDTITISRAASNGLAIFGAASDALAALQPGGIFLIYDPTGTDGAA